jgi:hypothetical protein
MKYISPKTTNLAINVKLKDGQYTLIDNKDRKAPKKIRYNITDDMPVYIFKSNVELKTTIALTEPDAITNEEAYFIDRAYMGGSKWCETDYEGQLYGIDRKSSYPAIVSSNRFVFPVKAGTLKNIHKKNLIN